MLDDDRFELEDKSDRLRSIIFQFTTILVDNQLLELFFSNLSRLDEAKTDEKQGVYNIISVVDNLVQINPSIADKIANNDFFVPWLVKRIGDNGFDSVRQYSSEILEILSQSSPKVCEVLGKLNAIDSMLLILSRYRKKDPSDSDETEMAENIFNSLCLLLTTPEGKVQFLQSEGFELMLLMIKYFFSFFIIGKEDGLEKVL